MNLGAPSPVFSYVIYVHPLQYETKVISRLIQRNSKGWFKKGRKMTENSFKDPKSEFILEHKDSLHGPYS